MPGGPFGWSGPARPHRPDPYVVRLKRGFTRKIGPCLTSKSEIGPEVPSCSIFKCASFWSSRMPEKRNPILKDFGIWASQNPKFFWPAGADQSLPEEIGRKPRAGADGTGHRVATSELPRLRCTVLRCEDRCEQRLRARPRGGRVARERVASPARLVPPRPNPASGLN